MAQLFKWKVIREHTGDRDYADGDQRIGTMADLGPLQGRLLELVGPVDGEVDAKAEPEPLNKAEPAAPANKAARSRKSKGK
jgi:hypothetical protein